MINSLFQKAVVISAISHVSVMCLFSLSAGPRPPLLNYAAINFFNGIVPAHERGAGSVLTSMNIGKIFFRKPNTAVLDNNRRVIFEPTYYVKPQTPLVHSAAEKITPTVTPGQGLRGIPKKEPVVMFYPSFPEHLLLYFTDRQTVHIELQYNVSSNDPASTVWLKRKISSGNLEADLLAMRYLSHYLFIQRARLPTDSWQTVKIELSPKHDQP